MMYFNPLFIDSSSATTSAAKSNKLNGANYLFADIIKIYANNSFALPQTTSETALNNEVYPKFNLTSIQNLNPSQPPMNSIELTNTAALLLQLLGSDTNVEAGELFPKLETNGLKAAASDDANSTQQLSLSDLQGFLNSLFKFFELNGTNLNEGLNLSGTNAHNKQEDPVNHILELLEQNKSVIVNLNLPSGQISIELSKSDLSADEQNLYLANRSIPDLPGKVSSGFVNKQHNSNQPAENSFVQSKEKVDLDKAAGTDKNSVSQISENISGKSTVEVKSTGELPAMITKSTIKDNSTVTKTELKPGSTNFSEVVTVNYKNQAQPAASADGTAHPDNNGNLKFNLKVELSLNLKQSSKNIPQNIESPELVSLNDQDVKLIDKSFKSVTTQLPAKLDFAKEVLQSEQMKDLNTIKLNYSLKEGKTASEFLVDVQRELNSSKEIAAGKDRFHFDFKAAAAGKNLSNDAALQRNTQSVTAAKVTPDVKSELADMNKSSVEVSVEESHAGHTKIEQKDQNDFNGTKNNKVVSEFELKKADKNTTPVPVGGETVTKKIDANLKSQNIAGESAVRGDEKVDKDSPSAGSQYQKNKSHEQKSSSTDSAKIVNENSPESAKESIISRDNSTVDHKLSPQKFETLLSSEKNKSIAPKERAFTDARQLQEDIKTIKSSEMLRELTSFFERGEKRSIVLRLIPESLGKVKVMLDMIDKFVHANIEVESEAVKQLVQTNLDALRQSLNQNGVQVNALNVSLSSPDQKSPRAFDGKKKAKFNDDAKKVEIDTEDSSKKILGYNTYEYLA